MRGLATTALAFAALGAASAATALADSSNEEMRDTLGLSNDWNHWKYASQTMNLDGRSYCNRLNCVYDLEREGATKLRR